MNFRFVLASNSPRRKQLLALTGLTYEVVPAEVDETPLADELPTEYVLRLAESKARAAARQIQGPALVFAADTTVVDGGTILGKPDNPADAVRMLEQLRGHIHQVYTGLALLSLPAGRLPGGRLWIDLGATDVPMRDYSEAEIQDYVRSGDSLDKAGAYAIQHPGFHPVAGLQGCYANVVGLPLCHLARTLRRAGVVDELGQAVPHSAGSEDRLIPLPEACQAFLGYSCPVYKRILRGDL